MNKIWLLVIGFLLASCHAVDIRETHSFQYQNHPVPENIWNSIDIGVTNTQWLLQHIGSPSSIEKNAGEQTFVYRYEEQVKERTSVFLFYQKQKIQAKERIHSVVLKNNIVVAHSDITPRPSMSSSSENFPASDTDAVAPAEKSNGSDSAEASTAQQSQGASAEPTPQEMPKSLVRDL